MRNLLILMLFPAFACASTLSDVADSLMPGTYTTLQTNLTFDDVTDGNISILTWSDSMGYDAQRGKIEAVCKRASNYTHKKISYDIAPNVWRVDDMGGQFSTSGHCYDGNTAGPNGLYFLQYYSKTVKYSDGLTFTALPDFPIPRTAAMSLTDTPAGLIAVGNGEHGAAIYDHTGTWTKIKPDGPWWGSYHVMSEYSPPTGITLIGGGNGGTNVLYTYDGDWRQLQSPPLTMRMSESLVSVNPSSGDFIVYDFNNSVWWSLDPLFDIWIQIPASEAPPTLSQDVGAIQAPIHDLGVIVILTLVSGEPTFYVYKPVDGVPAEPTPEPDPEPTQCPEPTACPEPQPCPVLDEAGVREDALIEAINAVEGIR